MSVTIKDIAKASGVSYSTVSKALNNSPLVKEQTKHKVLQTAKELGYQPNFLARNLVSKKSHIIGLVWPTIERIALSSLITKINTVIEENEYAMILSISDINSSVERFRRFQVDGIIIFEEEEETSIDPSILSSVPVISHGVPKNNPYPMIDVNQKTAIAKAVEHLYHLGHERISFVGDLSSHDPRQKEKMMGYRETMQHLNLPIQEKMIADTHGLSWYDGYYATKALLEQNQHPTAIIGGSYDISIGILRAIKESYLQIPEDISVIGYDNIPQMASLETPLTSVGVPIHQLATEIVNSLLQFIENPDERVPFVKTLSPELHERKSCGSPVKSKS